MSTTKPMSVPRSILHALAPYGLNTSEVESMTSYMCRLAHSHSMATHDLVQWVLLHFGQHASGKFLWHQRNFSGASLENERWAVWLAQLTGVGDLDRLTLLPWRHLVATPGLIPRSDRWCPCCFAQDKAAGREPYLRLAWEVAPVAVCSRHATRLVLTCPHCSRGNVRNRSAIVIPGYCTVCHQFLGHGKGEPATEDELWISAQIGKMLHTVPQVAPEGLVDLIKMIIDHMGESKVSTFAKRFGLSKSGVWHWINKGVVPGIRAWLTIALHGEIDLDRLFAGDLEGWAPHPLSRQKTLDLPKAYRAGIRSRVLDWPDIRRQLREMLQLSTPVSINEAGRMVGVGRKHLYLRANAQARAITARHTQYRAQIRKQREEQLVARIGEVLDDRLAQGFDGVSARNIWDKLDVESWSVESVFALIQQAIAQRRAAV